MIILQLMGQMMSVIALR